MKRLFFSLCAVGLSCAAFGAGPEVNIVPKPLSVTPGAGTFTVTASTVIGVGKNAELRRSARIFAGEVAPVVGGVMKTAAEGDVRLAVDGSLEAEAYTLAVTPSGVEVRGGTPQGVFHGLQSLRQLVIDGEGVVPAVTVSDKPYFAHRGGMLDPCRHFWTVDEVKEYIDILAIHKLNKFHWHLTDDQGWRIEIKKYPELTRVGSVRGETLIGHHHTSSEYDKTPHGGYYTQKQIREIVKYAADRYVTVIPEIELPGHAVAALTSYPWLGCKGEGYEVRRRWGISKEVFCPGKETTFEFLQNVFAEVLELFPSEFIHIGGDECPKDSWKQCPLCQERIRTEGLKDEFELQSYTAGRSSAGTRFSKAAFRPRRPSCRGAARRAALRRPRPATTSSWRPMSIATWTTTRPRPRRRSRWPSAAMSRCARSTNWTPTTSLRPGSVPTSSACRATCGPSISPRSRT